MFRFGMEVCSNNFTDSPKLLQTILFNVPQIVSLSFRNLYTETRANIFVPSSPIYRMLNFCNELKNVDLFYR